MVTFFGEDLEFSMIVYLLDVDKRQLISFDKAISIKEIAFIIIINLIDPIIRRYVALEAEHIPKCPDEVTDREQSEHKEHHL